MKPGLRMCCTSLQPHKKLHLKQLWGAGEVAQWKIICRVCEPVYLVLVPGTTFFGIFLLVITINSQNHFNLQAIIIFGVMLFTILCSCTWF